MEHPINCTCAECEADAKEWAACCRAMERAEGDYYDGYDPEAQEDMERHAEIWDREFPR